MSLLTDIIFVKALQSNTTLLGKLAAGDVYNTSIALPDQDLDNAPIPYVIVSFDGLVNDQSTKDTFEGETDTVQVSVEIAAKNRKQLGELATLVRRTIREYFSEVDEDSEDADLVPYDYQFSADRVQYDPLKPCHWQILRWQCDTNAE